MRWLIFIFALIVLIVADQARFNGYYMNRLGQALWRIIPQAGNPSDEFPFSLSSKLLPSRGHIQ